MTELFTDFSEPIVSRPVLKKTKVIKNNDDGTTTEEEKARTDDLEEYRTKLKNM